MLTALPAHEVKLPADEVKLPADEVKLPADEVKLPADEVKLRRNDPQGGLTIGGPARFRIRSQHDDFSSGEPSSCRSDDI